MDLQFSGQDTVIKTRKPYKLTKERGRWTTEEHDKFLEALKLYGRAWPRVREHIGTKTSLQIRSHAQKFFAKLESRPTFKGIPRVEAPDIDIPPPRPKRKATNPYPRKTRPASPSSQPEIRDGVILDFEKEKLDETTNHDNNWSEMGNLLHKESGSIASTDTSFISPMAALGNSCPIEGFLPSEKEVTDGDAQQFFQHNDNSKGPGFQNYYASLEQLDRAQSCSLPGSAIQPTQNYPIYVAVNNLDGSLGASLPKIHLKENASSESQNNDMICILRSSPDLQTPFIPLCHHTDDYIHASPTFSNLSSCALLQNPAAHAAASYPAALWPAESAVCNQRCFCSMQSKSSPGTAAISGVTVAGASAWWANHGLLPLSVPCHVALNCSPSVGNPGEAECFEKSPAQSSVFKPHLLTVSKESMDQNVNGAKECLDRGKGLLIYEHDHLSNCKIESWKKVSREGQLAFPVLYTGEVFPQSFSHKQGAATRETIGNMKHIEGGRRKSGCRSANVKSGCHPRDQSSEKNKSPTGNENFGKGKITIGHGHEKTSNHQTGFKPYKRCSTSNHQTGFKPYKRCSTSNHQTGFKPYKRCPIDKG